MKIFLFVAVIIIAFIGLAFGDCTFKGHTFKLGEKYQPAGECMQAKCNEGGKITEKLCTPIDSLKPCKYIPMDTTKPYPRCCPHQKC